MAGICSTPSIGERIWYDGFDGTPGSAIANGWSSLGTASGIRTDGSSWGMTSTTSGAVSVILRNSNFTAGRQRIDVKIGGTDSIGTVNTNLLMCMNAAGTAGLSARVTASTSIVLGYWTTTAINLAPTISTLGQITGGFTLANDNVISFNLYDGMVWFEQNGVTIVPPASATGAGAILNNPYVGVRAQRSGTVNSFSLQDFGIMQPSPT